MRKQILNYSFIGKLIVTVMMIVTSLSLVAQQGTVADLISSAVPPSNDDLCDALPLTVNSLCAGFAYTNIDATIEGSEIGGCGADIFQTVWFSFVAPASGEVDVVTDPEFGETMERYVFSEGVGFDCTDHTTLDVVDCNDDFGGAIPLELTGLIPGDTYYTRVQVPEPPFDTDFCIEFNTPPDNDNLCDATLLSFGDECIGYPYNNEDATLQAGEYCCDCIGGQDKSVWFKFVAPSIDPDEMMSLVFENMESGSSNRLKIYLFEEGGGFDCSDLTTLDYIDCERDDYGRLIFPAMTPGDTYYFSVGGYTAPYEADFCVELIITPINDIMCNAIELIYEGGSTCYTNEGAIIDPYWDEGPFGSYYSDCGDGILNTVWFYFEAPPSGIVIVETESGDGSIDIERMVLEMECCSIFEECDIYAAPDEFGCNNDDMVSGGELFVSGLDPGDYYYVVIQTPFDEEGVEFCIEVKSTAPENDDLCDAIEIIVDGSCGLETYPYTNIDASVQVGEPVGCSSLLDKSVWFTFEAPASGYVGIYLSDNSTGEDYETHVFEEGGGYNCSDLTTIDEIDCAVIDDVTSLEIPGLTPGDDYYVRIQFPSFNGDFFCIEIEELIPPVNDDLCNAIPLTLDESCVGYEYTTEFATAEVAEPGNCSSYTIGGTVWFSFEAPASGIVEIITSAEDVTPQLERRAFDSDGFDCNDLSTLVSLECNFDTGGDLDVLMVEDLCEGETYYIRIAVTDIPYYDDFCIEVVSIPTPDNDDICDAEFIEIGDSCTPYEYTNVGASLETGEPGGCGPSNNSSVWFYFFAPPSGSVTITTSHGGSLLVERHVFKPDPDESCNSFVTLDDIICQNDNDDTNDVTTICGLDPGEEYLLRIQTVVFCCGEGEDKPSSSFSTCYVPPTGEFCLEIEDAFGPTADIISEPAVCIGELVGELEYDNVQNDPVLYSVFFDAAAQIEGFVDIVWESFPPPVPGTIEIDIPIAVSPGVYNAEFVIHNFCSSFYDFTIEVTEPASLAVLTVSGPGVICTGDESALEVEITGGTPPFIITYSDGVDDFMVSDFYTNDGIGVMPTTTTSYSLIDVVDSKGCTAGVIDGSGEIIVNDGPGNAELTGGGNICLGSGTTISFNIDAGQSPYYVEYFDGIGFVPVFNYISGSSINVSPLVTTDYIPIYVEDANNCPGSVSGSATVTVFDPILDATLEGGGEICEGQSTDIWFTITGGTGPYEVTYFDGLFFETVSNYVSGDLIEVTPFATTTYTPVSIEDINSCGGPVNGMAEVVVNQGPNFANLLDDAAICEGDPAIISFDIVGGQAPYYVEYTDGIEVFPESGYTSGNPIFVFPTSTTTYTPVNVTDFNNCEAGVLEGEALITVYEYPGDATLEGGGEICSGTSSTIWFDIPAGTPPYYVEYFDGMDFIGVPNYISGVPIIVSPLVTTDYFSSTVIDANGCYAGIDGLVTVIVNDGPSLALINGTQAICPDATADLFVEITGGTSPYELVLYDGDSEFIIEDYLSGEIITVSPNEDTDYTIIQVTDANGCEANGYDGIAEITILDGPGVCTLDRLEEEICVGFSTSIFFVIESGNGPYTVTYTDEEDDFTLTDYQNGDLIPVMPIENTYYYPISVIDNDGCVGEVEGFTAVFVLQGPEEAIVEGSGAFCSGEDPSISIIIDGGFPPYIITYTDGDDIFEEDDYDSGDLIYLDPEGMVDYTILSVTDDDGCEFEINEVISIGVSDGPGLSTISGDAMICMGEMAEIFVNVSDGFGPYTLNITDGQNTFEVESYDSGDPIIVEPDAFSEYELVSVMDIFGCEGEVIGQAIVDVIEGPGMVELQGPSAICEGEMAELSFLINTGTAPYTIIYLDETEQEEVTLPDYISGTLINESPQVATTYTPISVIDANNCVGEFTGPLTIEVFEEPGGGLADGEFNLCLWESADLSLSIEGGTGPYTIVLNDVLNDTDTIITDFMIGETIMIAPGSSVVYNGVSVTDVNGCEGVLGGTVNITVEPYPQIVLVDQYCSEDMTSYSLEIMTDGSMLISDIGMVTANGGGLFTVSSIPEGMSVTVSSQTMLAMCMTEVIFNSPDCDCISVEPPMSNGDQSICDGDALPELSVTVNINETADWYDAPSNGNLLLMGSLVYNPSMAGLYYAETRDLDTDCVSLVRTGVELRINDIPSVTITGNSEICRDQESTILDAGGNYSSYLWSSGEDTQTIEIFSEGEYSVMVSDEFGCLGESSITVNELEPPSVEITGLTSICAGQSTELGLGESYESIQWSTGEDTEVITVQEVGVYSVMVTDINGCEGGASVTIAAFEDPQVEITGIASICAGQSTDLGLGDSYESVLWSTGEDTEIITVQEVGEYSVMVTDINGCTGEASITVNEFDIEEISIIGDAVICEGAFSNLSIEGTFQSYMWSTGEESESISVSEAGLYSLTVMDENGCRSEATFELMVEDGLGFETKFLANKSVCVGDTVHLFDISEIDTAADEYFWDFGDGNSSTERDPEHTYTMPGSYDVQLIATVDGCINKSIFKQIDVFDCRREIYDDSNFAYINVAPNPSDGTFSLILEFITVTDALIELYTVDGILLHSEFFSGKLIRKNFDLRETGVYFIKVKTPFYSKAKKVLVHK